MRQLLPLALLLGLLAGCGTSDDRDQARATVERFYAAVEADDAEAACEQLGESLLEAVESQTQQSCAGVITRFDYEPGPIDRTEVYITNAKVDLVSGESAFLSRETGRLEALGHRLQGGEGQAGRPAVRVRGGGIGGCASSSSSRVTLVWVFIAFALVIGALGQ